MYTVISLFKDEDGKTYEAGDTYSVELSEERERVLTTSENKYGHPFIRLLKGKKEVEKTKETKKEKKK